MIQIMMKLQVNLISGADVIELFTVECKKVFLHEVKRRVTERFKVGIIGFTGNYFY